jgi:hypothetical protein
MALIQWVMRTQRGCISGRAAAVPASGIRSVAVSIVMNQLRPKVATASL